MNIKSIVPSLYFKNYYAFMFLSCIIFIAVSLPFPSNSMRLLMVIRQYVEIPLIYVLSGLAVFNFFMYIKNFITKTYNTSTIPLKVFFMTISWKIVFYILSLFIETPKIYENKLMGMPYVSYVPYVPDMSIIALLAHFFWWAWIFFVFFVISLNIHESFKLFNKEKPKYHWINEFLSEKQITNSKKLEHNGKIVSVYFKGFVLDELNNSLLFGRHKLKLNVFKEYMSTNQYKVNDLTESDIIVIEMLGI